MGFLLQKSQANLYYFNAIMYTRSTFVRRLHSADFQTKIYSREKRKIKSATYVS